MSEQIQNAQDPAEEFVEVQEPWGHPGQPTVDEVPPEMETRRREATRRQQRMTEDKTGKAD